MTQENNSFDDFLQRKVEDAEFAFKEDYWEKMQQVLDDDEKEKKKPFWWRGIYVFVAALIVGAGALLYSNASKHAQENTSSEFVQNEVSTTVVSEKVHEGNATVAKNTNENKIENEKTNESQLDNSNQQSTTDNNHADVKENELKSTARNTTVNTTATTATDFSTANDQVAAASKNRKRKTNKTLSLNPSINSTSGEKVSNKKRKKGINKVIEHDVNGNVDPADDLNNSVAKNNTKANVKSTRKNSTKHQNMLAKTKTKNDTKDAVENTQKVNQIVPQSSSVALIKGKKMNAIDSSVVTPKKRNGQEFNPRYVAGLGAYTAERIDSISIVTYSPVQENATNGNGDHAASSSQMDSSKSKNKNPLSVFAMIGINANKGFKSDISNPTSWGVSPMLSFGVEKIIAPKLTMSSQIGFTYFNALNVNYSVPNYRYSFGLDSTIFSVDYKKMLQLYLPVSVQYQLAKKHFILGGVGASYSFALSSNVKENQQATATQSYNYRGGFNQLDLFVQAGYLYKVNNAFSLFGYWQQGLIDATDNTYFNNSISTKQSKVSVGIKYNFKRNGLRTNKK